MEDILKVIGYIILMVALLCVAPLIFLWCVNSLSELGGSSFYIPHSIQSYAFVIILLAFLKYEFD